MESSLGVEYSGTLLCGMAMVGGGWERHSLLVENEEW